MNQLTFKGEMIMPKKKLEICTTGVVHLNIANAECWKCNKTVKIAWCTEHYDDGSFGSFYGPEAFNKSTIDYAKLFTAVPAV